MADKTPASSEVLDEHYRNLADEYDEFLHYSDDFVRTLTAEMIEEPRRFIRNAALAVFLRSCQLARF